MSSGRVAGLLGALGVAAAAFGAHALRGRLEPGDLALFETAARHHVLHALAAVVAADRAQRRAGSPLPAWLFIAGIAAFSGSLYGLALGAPRGLGALTPVGGVAFIAGWVGLAWSFRRQPSA